MLCATISLPQPLSPVTSTFASDRAMRSISSRRATMSGLWPISRTAFFVVDVIDDNPWPVRSSACETLDDVTMVVGQVQESRADFIALAARSLRDSSDFDLGREGLAAQIKTQAATSALFRRLAGKNQHAGEADIEETHRHVDREHGKLRNLDVKSRRSSSFLDHHHDQKALTRREAFLKHVSRATRSHSIARPIAAPKAAGR